MRVSGGGGVGVFGVFGGSGGFEVDVFAMLSRFFNLFIYPPPSQT